MVSVTSGIKRGRATIAAAAIVAALCGCAPAAGPDARPTAEEDVAAIAAFNERYLGAINDGDIETLASLTTDGHLMIMPGRPPLVGKKANIDAMAGAFEQNEFVETWQPEETVVSGDLAYQRGAYQVIAKPRAGGEPRTTTGTFLRIYRRQPDGAWRMTHDTFNSVGSVTD
jgi:uncharacterized protein (TIGR02246 family)